MSLTLIIVIITGLVSYNCFENASLFSKLAHHPYSVARHGEYHRFLTSGFVHADWMHLIINMFVLYEFGQKVEFKFLDIFGEMQGRLFYLALYVIGIIISDIPTFFKHKDHEYYRSVGASGAVSAVLFAYILFFPWSMFLIYFIIPMYGVVAGVLYLIYSTYAGKQSGGRINHDAHLYGALFGFFFTILLKPEIFMVFLHQLSHPPFLG